MAIMIIFIALILVLGAVALLTALINAVLVALGLSTISWWVVVLILVIVKLFKWLIS